MTEDLPIAALLLTIVTLCVLAMTVIVMLEPPPSLLSQMN